MEDTKDTTKRKYEWNITPERREELRLARLANMRRGINASKAKKAEENKETNDET